VRRLIASAAAALIIAAAGAAVAQVGRESGLPVPRFVSLGASVANLRLGPGADDAVVAVYRRQGLPLKVVDEEDNWRQVEDYEGERGWIHSSLLSGRRTAIVVEGDMVLRRAPGSVAPAIAAVERTVVAALLSCDGAWCFVEVQGRRGWLARAGLWGVEP
jgi:SH3-like domain-containing protein